MLPGNTCMVGMVLATRLLPYMPWICVVLSQHILMLEYNYVVIYLHLVLDLFRVLLSNDTCSFYQSFIGGLYMTRYILKNALHYVPVRVCILANSAKGAMRWANANGFYDRFNYLEVLP